MGLLFESHDETLRLTGVPVRFVEPTKKNEGGLVVKFMIVSNPQGKVIDAGAGPETTIPLPEDVRRAIAIETFGKDDQLVIDLKRAEPRNSVDQALHEILSDIGSSLYEITSFRKEPNPMVIYKSL